ncbi:hypothetical protein KVT40_002242 [Elsinoe batatas]|uniref:Major facilitator superfamily (MFS) profile domain-containing protein n=1 Tax=Elsinoe batatas TaxID=2601811 RepID=A0A8K0LEA4_9PEZI|nr:hypothetical protein KVT40_002242 [Elsinoe batatas]
MTVDRITVGSSSNHHGIALWPPPSTDEKDPLRWPKWVKIVAILSVALFNFTANFAGAGFSVATPVLEMQFQKTASQVNALLTFNFLLLGVGNMFWVPIATKFGKRFSLLASMAMLFAILIWTAKAKTYNELLAARCLSGFASSAGESLVPEIVADIFFLHERAGMMSLYVILTSGATAIGPLIAGFVIAGNPGTWRDFSWVCAALAGFNLVVIYLFYPESTFRRPMIYEVVDAEEIEKENDTRVGVVETEGLGVQHVSHVQVSWPKVWTSLIRYDRSIGFFQAFTRQLAFILYPSVLWAVLVYGTALASQVILIFAFPSLLLAPPYFFAETSVGLIQVAAIIGFVLACFGGGYLSDLITTRQIVKAKGAYFPEQRLISLMPGAWVGCVGCIVIAFTCANRLSWIGIAFGFGIVSFGTVFAPNIAITYVVESHSAFASDCLVIINVFKNLVAFIFLYVAVDWVQASGWIQVYMIMFMLVAIAALLAIPLYLYGEKLRGWSERLYSPKRAE